MASLFGAPGIGYDNNSSNLIPQTYNLAFLDQIATPLQAVAQGGADNTGGGVLASLLALERSGPATDPTNTILKDAVPKPKDPRKREVPTVTGDGAILGNILGGSSPAAQKINKLTELPILAEPSPGIFSGKVVNTLLNPQDVPLEVNAEGRIFGGPFTQQIPKRISQLNGFGYTVNPNIYAANPRAVGTPLRPIIENNFYVRYGTSQGAMNVGRINVNSGTSSTGYLGLVGYNFLNQVWKNVPSGTIVPQTQNLSLYVNNMPGRILYLTRRKEPYYFHLPFAADYAGQLPAGTNAQALDTYGGLYFTTDPVGGGPWNDVNIINGQASPPPILPNAPYILYPGGTIQIVVDNTWPDICYYQSTSGPFMGGVVIAVGSYNYV